MVVPKQVEYEIADTAELESSLTRLRNTTSQGEGRSLRKSISKEAKKSACSFWYVEAR